MNQNIKKRLDEIERRMMPKPERDEAEFFEYCTMDSTYDRAKTLAENLADAEFPDDVLPQPVSSQNGVILQPDKPAELRLL